MFTSPRVEAIDLYYVKSETGEYGPVEDAHLVLNHILAHWFQFKLR
jgi:hypothetical protein